MQYKRLRLKEVIDGILMEVRGRTMVCGERGVYFSDRREGGTVVWM